MKTKISLFLIVFLWLPSVQAYPWMFFRESGFSTVQLDTHSSYFLNGKITIFSGFQLEYHNPKIDLNIGYNYSFLEERHYSRISELSVIFPIPFDNWTMSLGIKDVLWSEADRYWNHGLWQARYLLDPLRPKQLGIPGIYFEHETDTSNFLISFSYFYIPDIIIFPKFKDNKIVSKNPFFINTYNKFNWKVDEFMPFEIKEFFKPSLAFRFQHFVNNYSINFSYAYKPINQFQKVVKIEGLDLSTSSKSSFNITNFRYFVLSHHLASLESETALSKRFSLFTSLFWEQPEQRRNKVNWLSDDFLSHLTYSLMVYFKEKWEKDKKTLFTLGWTKTVEKTSDLASNPVIIDFRDVFKRNFNWKSAVSASIEHEDKTMPVSFLSRFRVNYALDNQFYQFILENYLYLSSHLRIYVSGDLFFRFSKESIPANSSSIKQYDGLSRILFGGQYVF
ncbi:MAG: hypothetical protein OXC37_02980 [Bdellovibrionaceae bacterium]|nr:hypothetical protein [Pseudobdellovibrionaceae bacterium]